MFVSVFAFICTTQAAQKNGKPTASESFAVGFCFVGGKRQVPL
jgi:hypothetical protein